MMSPSNSSTLPRCSDSIGRWLLATSKNRFWYIWTQSGWVPYLGIGMFIGPILVSAFPALVGPWVFYTTALFALGIFADGLIVFVIDRRRGRTGLRRESPAHRKRP